MGKGHMDSKERFAIALAGNPNAGKTTIFNKITGERQKVGNYAGVTVETKTGYSTHKGVALDIVDLPGTYSLTAYSVEEVVARNYIINENPDVLIDIIDMSNLERNLYLATQFIELGVPLVFAFNMSDIAKSRGYEVDIKMLSELLDVPIVPTVGHKDEGVDEMLDAAIAIARSGKAPKPAEVKYGRDIEQAVKKIIALLMPNKKLIEKYRPRWVALKLLENDSEVRGEVRANVDNYDEIIAEVEACSKHINTVCGDQPEIIIADRRYGFISGACQEALVSSVEVRHTTSDKIDSVLINKILGLPIFAVTMFLLFQLIFAFGNPLVDLLDSAIGSFGAFVSAQWPAGADSLLRSLIVDGIIGGVGSVLVFLPLIVLMFIVVSILEDSGYMARAAFIMDRIMHKIGLHGKSFIPMLIGFGCSVPAIMATRTLESRRDRITTIMITPLMSCGARLPIYTLIIAAFFSQKIGGTMLWLIYIIGIIVAVLSAKLLRITVLKGEATPFVMELPPYRMPTLRGILTHMWDRSWMYLRKAGTIILAAAIILWVLTTFPRKTEFDVDYELLGEKARAEYLAEASTLSADIKDLRVDSTTLAEVLDAEIDTPDDVDTILARDAAAGAKVRELLEMRDKIIAARQEYAIAVEDEGLQEGTFEHMKREHLLEENLAEIAATNPELYPVALELIDDIKSKYIDDTTGIAYRQMEEELAYTVAGRIGHTIEPVIRLMGFDWRIGTALIGAFAAKEVFVAQIGVVFSLGGEVDEKDKDLRQRLQSTYNPLIGFCIMLFSLLSLPCMATFAVTKAETNSWGWAFFQIIGLTVVAFIITVAVYQVGVLLKIGIS